MSIEQDLVLREYWIGYLRERSLEVLGEQFHITHALYGTSKQAATAESRASGTLRSGNFGRSTGQPGAIRCRSSTLKRSPSAMVCVRRPLPGEEWRRLKPRRKRFMTGGLQHD